MLYWGPADADSCGANGRLDGAASLSNVLTTGKKRCRSLDRVLCVGSVFAGSLVGCEEQHAEQEKHRAGEDDRVQPFTEDRDADDRSCERFHQGNYGGRCRPYDAKAA